MSNSIKQEETPLDYRRPRPHQCSANDCDMFFQRKSDLVRHMKIHNGEREHECPYPGCSFRAREADRIKIHCNTHTGLKPYRCQEGSCTKAYSDPSSLTKHRSKKHGHVPAGRDMLYRAGHTVRKLGLKRQPPTRAGKVDMAHLPPPPPESATPSPSAPSTLPTPTVQTEEVFPEIQDFEGHADDVIETKDKSIGFEFNNESSTFTWQVKLTKTKKEEAKTPVLSNKEEAAASVVPACDRSVASAPTDFNAEFLSPFAPGGDSISLFDDPWLSNPTYIEPLTATLYNAPRFDGPFDSKTWVEPTPPEVLFAEMYELSKMEIAGTGDFYTQLPMPTTSMATYQQPAAAAYVPVQQASAAYQPPSVAYAPVQASLCGNVMVPQHLYAAQAMPVAGPSSLPPNALIFQPVQRPMSTRQHQERRGKQHRMQVQNIYGQQPYQRHQTTQVQWPQQYAAASIPPFPVQYQSIQPTYFSPSAFQLPSSQLHPLQAQGSSSLASTPSQFDQQLYNTYLNLDDE